MKVLVFGVDDYEKKCIEEGLSVPEIEKVKFVDGVLTLNRMDETIGFDAVWIITNSIIHENEARELEKRGVKYIVTRSTGIDHLDIDALKKHHIRVAFVPPYSPSSVSEHTVLLLLALLRRLKKSVRMCENSDFTLDGLMGNELGSLTVGVIGAGRIGQKTIQILNGFGGRILVNTNQPVQFENKNIICVDKETLFKESDAIVLHCPLTDENYHMINKETIALMKDGSLLVNSARGGLVDTYALCEALDSGKLSGVGLDVYEFEDDFVRTKNKRYDVEFFGQFIKREDVIYTAHTAFYTKQAMDALLNVTIQNLIEYAKDGFCKNDVYEG